MPWLKQMAAVRICRKLHKAHSLNIKYGQLQHKKQKTEVSSSSKTLQVHTVLAKLCVRVRDASYSYSCTRWINLGRCKQQRLREKRGGKRKMPLLIAGYSMPPGLGRGVSTTRTATNAITTSWRCFSSCQLSPVVGKVLLVFITIL